MPVLDRDALAESPLADLHLLAAELGVDGFRRLRRDDLIDAILARPEGEGEDAQQEPAPATDVEPEGTEVEPEAIEVEAEATEDEPEATEDEPEATEDEPPTRGRRRRRGGRGRRRDGDEEEDAPRAEAAADEEADAEGSAEGTVELLGNGSAFLRLSPPDPSDDDVYVSAAQVRRCELVSGDRVAGPVRPPRRSERHPSLVRVETINGRPADEVAEGTPWEDLPADFARSPWALGTEDAALEAVARHAPFGRGSRVLVVGPSRAGKTRLLFALAGVLKAADGVEVSVALAGARPEESGLWREADVETTASLSFSASPDAQAQAIENAVEQARRAAARGSDAVVLIDTLAYLPPGGARRILAAARNIPDGGSLTLVATAPEPLGGETTVVALSGDGTVDPERSGTLRADLLAG
jgi:transcription termination factor Rho